MIAASLAIAAFLCFLPTLLCLEPVLGYTLDRINSQLPGSLEVRSCSLGWRQGLRCEDLRYQEQTLGIRVTAPRLTGDKGLLVLLLAPRYLGELDIEQPILTFLPKPAGDDKTKAAAGTAPARTSWWERLTLRFQVHKGLIELDQGHSPKQELARDLDLKGSLAVGTVNYSLAFRSGLQQEGSLRAEGFINLPTARQSLLDTLVSQTEVTVTGLEIAAFLDLAASRSNAPNGQGVLDATCHVVTAGVENLEVRGETSLRGVRLSGGFLGQDQPAVDHLLFNFKGRHRGEEGWQLTTLQLASDPLRIEANGSYDRTTASLAAKGSVNLPVLAAQLPHLLSLHEKTTFREGLIDFSLKVSGIPEELEIKADCRTGLLAVVHNGQAFSWDAPLSLVAKADRRQGKTTVRTLRAHTPFLDVQGSGGTDDFTLRATADLERMFGELKKIFALNFHGKGKMEVTGSSMMQTDGRYRLDTRIGINGFTLSRGDLPLLPSHDFLLTGEAWTPPSFFRFGSFTSLRLAGDSWLGKLSLFVQNREQQIGKMATSCSANGVIDLERMHRFFQGVSGVLSTVKLGGLFSFDSSGGLERNRLSLEVLNGKVDHLTVLAQGYSHREPQVTVSLANKALTGSRPVRVRELMRAENWQDFVAKEQPGLVVDFPRHRLDLRHLTLETSGAAVHGSFTLEDWRQPHRDFTAEIMGKSDSTPLIPIFSALGWFPEDMTLKGRVETTLKAEARGEQGVLTELVVQMEPFELLRANKKWFSDPRLRLKAIFQGNWGGDGDVRIPAFVLQTTPLQVEGSGRVQGKAPVSLELQGTLTPDLSYFSNLLQTATGEKMVLIGKREGVFQFAGPFKLPVAVNQMTLSARLPVDSLQYQGLTLRQLEIPVEMDRGMLRAVIAGEVNGGRVALQPHWNLATRRPVVTLPPSSQVLKDVLLQPSLQEGVLGKIHPLFGVLTRPEGTIDLRVDGFSWPLETKGGQRPLFKTTMGLGKIELKPARILRDLLDLGGIDHQALQLKEVELTCEGKDNRISCTPLHLMAGEVEIGISGTVGMDGALAYLIRMPLTEQLAAAVKLPPQQGATVTAEVGGTVDTPFIDPEAFLARVTAQLGEAVVKDSELEPEPSTPDNQPKPDHR